MLQADANLEVRISPEMRALFAQKSGKAVTPFTAAGPYRHQQGGKQGKDLGGAEIWQKHSLRRDGKRPFAMNATLVARFSGQLELSEQHCVQTVSIFVTQAQSVVLALSLEMPDRLSARSLHRVVEPLAINPARSISQWCQDVAEALRPVSLTDPHDRAHPELIGIFNKLTHHIFDLSL